MPLRAPALAKPTPPPPLPAALAALCNAHGGAFGAGLDAYISGAPEVVESIKARRARYSRGLAQ